MYNQDIQNIQLLYEDFWPFSKVLTLYRGNNVKEPKLVIPTVYNKSIMAMGMGLYFTDNIEEAQKYGKFITTIKYTPNPKRMLNLDQSYTQQPNEKLKLLFRKIHKTFVKRDNYWETDTDQIIQGMFRTNSKNALRVLLKYGVDVITGEALFDKDIKTKNYCFLTTKVFKVIDRNY